MFWVGGGESKVLSVERERERESNVSTATKTKRTMVRQRGVYGRQSSRGCVCAVPFVLYLVRQSLDHMHNSTSITAPRTPTPFSSLLSLLSLSLSHAHTATLVNKT